MPNEFCASQFCVGSLIDIQRSDWPCDKKSTTAVSHTNQRIKNNSHDKQEATRKHEPTSMKTNFQPGQKLPANQPGMALAEQVQGHPAPCERPPLPGLGFWMNLAANKKDKRKERNKSNGNDNSSSNNKNNNE